MCSISLISLRKPMEYVILKIIANRMSCNILKFILEYEVLASKQMQTHCPVMHEWELGASGQQLNGSSIHSSRPPPQLLIYGEWSSSIGEREIRGSKLYFINMNNIPYAPGMRTIQLSTITN